MAVLQPTGCRIASSRTMRASRSHLPSCCSRTRRVRTPPSLADPRNARPESSGQHVQHVKQVYGRSSLAFRLPPTMSSAGEVSGIILRALVQAALTRLGEPIEDVVITVPPISMTLDAQPRSRPRAVAGLNVLRRTSNEPTAAALSYGISTKMTDMCSSTISAAELSTSQSSA